MKNISVWSGNAVEDSAETRGWFVGHFVDPSLGLRHTGDVEVKWASHKAGDARTEWVAGETRTAITILVSGKIEIEFRDQAITLSRPGDYAMWGEGTDHRWRVIEDSVAMTIRWPSVPNY